MININQTPVPDGSIIAVLGAQWGDEGKGKFIDQLAAQTDICCRFNGGSNAGHTILWNNREIKLHLVPCGIMYDNVVNLLGHGMVIDITKFFKEVEEIEQLKPGAAERIFISSRAHIVFDFHIKIDASQEIHRKEISSTLGTTRQGIGPAYASKCSRTGIRISDLLNFDKFKEKYLYLSKLAEEQYKFESDHEELQKFELYAQKIKPFVVDGILWIHQQIQKKKKILIEGANATLLDIDCGTYPYVTSSSTTVGGIAIGLGIPTTLLTEVFGVVKAYTTRVGNGPFMTELENELAHQIRTIGKEYGATTGRPRRCGWFDSVAVKFSVVINGFTKLNLTKLDVLTGIPLLKICSGYKHRITGIVSPPMSLPVSSFDYDKYEPIYETFEGWDKDLSTCKKYSEFPQNAQTYVERIEFLAGCPIDLIGVGRKRNAFIKKN